MDKHKAISDFMKYLFLIIRHLFPRRRWKEVEVINAVDRLGDIPRYRIYRLQDQFGNMKTVRVK